MHIWQIPCWAKLENHRLLGLRKPRPRKIVLAEIEHVDVQGSNPVIYAYKDESTALMESQIGRNEV